MKTIRKYIPFLFFAVVAVVYLGGQFAFNFGDTTARISGKAKKINAHYESMFQKSVFKTTDGKELNLKKEKAPIVILNFWASWCQPCLEEFPSLTKLQGKFKADQVKVVGINTDVEKQQKEIKKTVKKYELNFPIVADDKGDITANFMVDAIPVSIIYHKGKVIEVSNGSKDFYSEEVLEQFKTILKD